MRSVTISQLITFGLWRRMDLIPHPLGRSSNTNTMPTCAPPALEGCATEHVMSYPRRLCEYAYIFILWFKCTLSSRSSHTWKQTVFKTYLLCFHLGIFKNELWFIWIFWFFFQWENFALFKVLARNYLVNCLLCFFIWYRFICIVDLLFNLSPSNHNVFFNKTCFASLFFCFTITFSSSFSISFISSAASSSGLLYLLSPFLFRRSWA